MEKRKYILKNIIINAVLSITAVIVLFVSIFSGVIAVGTTARPINRGESENSVALMFNIHWGTELIQPLLNTLEQNGITASFFIGGSWAFHNEETLISIHSMGHEIGNLGYFQLDHRQVNQARSREDIQANHRLIHNILSINMTLFTPPLGLYSDATLKAASSLNYTVITPTIDTFDWRDRNRTLIHDRAVYNLQGGNFILLHPTIQTLEALPNIITTIRNKGFNITTVTNLLTQAI